MAFQQMVIMTNGEGHSRYFIRHFDLVAGRTAQHIFLVCIIPAFPQPANHVKVPIAGGFVVSIWFIVKVVW